MNTSATSAEPSGAKLTATEGDRLIDFREAASLLGYSSNTSHALRRLAAAGKIRAVQINSRVVRYSSASVRALIHGGAA